VRVLHVASGREWRGGQRQVLLLARGLAGVPDVDSAVMTGRGTLLAERLHHAGVLVLEVPWGPGLDPRVVASLIGAVDRATIVHVHDSHAHALADVAARWRRAPLVVTRRDIPRIHHGRRYRRAAAVIAISRAVRQCLLDAGVDANRIRVVPDGVDLDAYAERERTTHRSMLTADASAAASTDTPLIVCIAALRTVKGIDVLLDAAAALRPHRPDARWIVLGEGRERPRLEAQRADLGLTDIVQLPGFVPAPEDILARATIAVQPSRVEALSSSVLDALALGVPVVATTAGGLPEALAHGGGVLVPPGSPRELAAAIGRLLDDQAERRRLGDAGRVAAGHFSVDRLVQRTLDVYRSVAQTQEVG
jgi:glycosyltransferase involved in cell wall biosynthesis